jgi:hypothetical protein
MLDMLYLISGAVASGKSTVSSALVGRVPNLVKLSEHVVPGHPRLAFHAFATSFTTHTHSVRPISRQRG